MQIWLRLIVTQIQWVERLVRSRRRPLRSLSRGHTFSLVGLLVALGVSGCHPRVSEASEEAPWAQLWFDQYAPAGGDGTQAHPWRALNQSIYTNSYLHFGTGIYEGPLNCTRCVLEATGRQAVIASTSGQYTAQLTDTQARGLSFQGAAQTLEVRGHSSLTQVTVSGFSRAGLVVAPGSQVTIEGLSVVSTVPQTTGVQSAQAQLTMSGVQVSGPMKRGLAVQQTELTVSGLKSLGPATAIHATDSHSVVSMLTSAGGMSAGVFVARGSLQLRQSRITGHEYGVQAGVGTSLVLHDVESVGAQNEGLAATECSVVLDQVRISHAGAGALTLLGSDTTGTRVQLTDNQEHGAFVRLGSLSLEALDIQGVTGRGQSGGGDGLLVRQAQARIKGLVIGHVTGAAVSSSAQASVTVDALTVSRASFGALVADTEGRADITLATVTAVTGPLFSALSGSQVSLGRVEARQVTEPLVWAECETGAQVNVTAVEGVPVNSAPCVTSGPRH